MKQLFSYIKRSKTEFLTKVIKAYLIQLKKHLVKAYEI